MTRSVFLAPLGRFYLVEVDETTILEINNLPRGKDLSEQDAIELLEQNEDAVAIYEVCEGRFSDASANIAEVWLKQLAADFVPGETDWPDFIKRHVSPSTLHDIEEEIYAERSWARQELNERILSVGQLV
jgi:hypothetical protein